MPKVSLIFASPDKRGLARLQAGLRVMQTPPASGLDWPLAITLHVSLGPLLWPASVAGLGARRPPGGLAHPIIMAMATVVALGTRPVRLVTALELVQSALHRRRPGLTAWLASSAGPLSHPLTLSPPPFSYN